MLGIAMLECNIPQSRFAGTSSRDLKHLPRRIHADRMAIHRDAGGLTRRLSCPAADIEHAISCANAGGRAQVLIVPL